MYMRCFFPPLFILDFLQSNKVFAIYGLDHNNYRFCLVDASIKCSELAIHGVLRHRRQVDITVVTQKICCESRLLVSCFPRLADQVLSFYITRRLSNLFCNIAHRTE